MSGCGNTCGSSACAVKDPCIAEWCYMQCGTIRQGLKITTVEKGKAVITFYDENDNIVPCEEVEEKYETIKCPSSKNIQSVFGMGGKMNIAKMPVLKDMCYRIKGDASAEVKKGYFLATINSVSDTCDDDNRPRYIMLSKSLTVLSSENYELVEDCGTESVNTNITGQDVPLEIINKPGDCFKVDQCPGKVWDVKITDQPINVKQDSPFHVINDNPVEVKNVPGQCLATTQCPGDTWKVSMEGVDVTFNPAAVMKVDITKSIPLEVINKPGTCLTIDQCPDKEFHVIVDQMPEAGETGWCLSPAVMSNKCVNVDDGASDVRTNVPVEHTIFYDCEGVKQKEIYLDGDGKDVTSIATRVDGLGCCG